MYVVIQIILTQHVSHIHFEKTNLIQLPTQTATYEQAAIKYKLN